MGRLKVRDSHGVVKIEGIPLQLQFDPHNRPCVKFGSASFTLILPLMQAIPALARLHHLKELAHILNFLLSGNEYHFIEDIKQFQDAYLERVEFEHNTLDYLPSRMTTHGVFDLSAMHPPKISNGKLIFYVKNNYSGVPYRVICPYPITSDTPQLWYQLLPYQE
jgi:hypothetical protein